MLKKNLTFIIITLISLQIPLIVSLSTAGQAHELLDTYQSKMAHKYFPGKAIGGIFSTVISKTPFINKVPLFSSVTTGGKNSLEDAHEVITQGINVMYGSIFLMFILMVCLFFITRKSFIKNLGILFLISGVLCLINVVIINHFFIANFNDTFKYFYNQIHLPPQAWLLLFMPKMIKSFSKEFLAFMAHSVMVRNMMAVLISFPVGIVLRFLSKLLFSKK